MRLKKKKTVRKSVTEAGNPASGRIDAASSYRIAQIINSQDRRVATAVQSELKAIAKGIDMVGEAFANGGRLFYVGAGTSGRLGVLDAAECPPTFGISRAKVQGILAGGKRALWRSVEGAEDNLEAGAQSIRKARVDGRDVVCGISASGKTPFVRGALMEAKKRKARRLLISCHPIPAMAPWAELLIRPVVGPEVIAGSTRMKAGTATKMVLNMISTGAMIRLGKVYQNLMVDVKPLSRKLQLRAEGILMTLLGCSRLGAKNLLEKAKGRAKVAVVMGAQKCSAKEADRRLRGKKGFLREIL
jgi:N-acetylmuramic acid 6-phosphate etherase